MIATLLLSALVAQATAYRIDAAASEAGFELKATLHTVHGSTTNVTGDVRAAPAAAGALALSGRIEIAARTIATGNAKRDATLHTTSLDVATYPAIVLEPERFAPNAPPGADGALSGTLTGTLTIRGVAKRQDIAATLAPGDGRIVASGAFDVVWAEFGIPDPSFFVVRIDKIAHAHFRATFAPVP